MKFRLNTIALIMSPAAAIILTGLAGLLVSGASAQSAGYDAANGRRQVAYPPHRVVDYRHMRLEITIPDMNVPKAHASETLSISPIRGEASSVVLDCKGLKIKSVMCANHIVDFSTDEKQLTLTFTPPLAEGVISDIVTEYEIDNPRLGFVWTTESSAWPGRAPQIHTQGEPETNSYWFPCHDFPNEKLTTELIVTAPAGFEVCSNGRLVSSDRVILVDESQTGERSLLAHVKWHYLQDKPHANYLVTLVVGKFDVVDVGTKALPMPVYVPPGRGRDVKATYGRTAAMVAHFGELLGEPYAWDKYAQLVVCNFSNGGMENTSATSLYDTAIIGEKDLADHDLDGLISHELGHQWFGDLLTCNSWEHIWLNEGFATYMTALWMEHRDGVSAYQQSIRGSMDGIIANDKAGPDAVGMVSKIYEHPWETFRKPANPYGKGSSILHMLRVRLGDDLFFKGLRDFVQANKFKTVETVDLRNSFERVSGQSLEQFFTQWCYRPGVPELTVNADWNKEKKALELTITQDQPIDGANPAFELSLPVVVRMGTTEIRREMAVNGKSANATIACDQEPRCVIVDPDMAVLGKIKVVQPADRFRAQLAEGPTEASQCAAIRGLATGSSGESKEMLRRLADDRTRSSWLRVEAIRRLATMGALDDIRSLSTSAVDRWEVREALVSALESTLRDASGKLRAGSDGGIRLLRDRAERDRSLKVRCAAIRALGSVKCADAASLFTNALEQESQSDALRQAGIDALASLDDGAYLEAVLACTQDGFDCRTRPMAMAAAAKLSHHSPDAVFDVLAKLLKDRELRAARGAGDALVQMKHPKAAEAIKEALGGESAEELVWQREQWLKALATK